MMKRAIPIIIVVVVTFLGLAYTTDLLGLNPIGENIKTENGDSLTVKGGTYTVEGVPVSLKGSTRYFGNEARGDINGDGIEDVVFLLTQNDGGSGTFYYAAAAIRTATGYQGKNAIYLGDRIAPQTTSINDQIIEVNFATRKPDEPMTTRPSVGMTMRLKFEDGSLVAIEDR